jgi:hypothetical protein
MDMPTDRVWAPGSHAMIIGILTFKDGKYEYFYFYFKFKYSAILTFLYMEYSWHFGPQYLLNHGNGGKVN